MFNLRQINFFSFKKLVILKKSFFYSTIGHIQDTFTILLTIFPLAFINRSIIPIHLPVTISIVHYVVAFIIVAWFPFKYTVTVLKIIFECPSIIITVRLTVFFPFTLAVFQSIFKFTSINSAVLPFVGTIAVRFTINIGALKLISICKNICTLTMFQRVFPIPFIFVTIFPNMDTSTLHMTTFPLTNVTFTFFSFPNTNTFFNAFFPLSIINFSIFPSINTFTVSFVILKLS